MAKGKNPEITPDSFEHRLLVVREHFEQGKPPREIAKEMALPVSVITRCVRVIHAQLVKDNKDYIEHQLGIWLANLFETTAIAHEQLQDETFLREAEPERLRALHAIANDSGDTLLKFVALRQQLEGQRQEPKALPAPA